MYVLGLHPAEGGFANALVTSAGKGPPSDPSGDLTHRPILSNFILLTLSANAGGL